MDTVRCYDKSISKTLKAITVNCKIKTNEHYKRYRDANPTQNIDYWNKNRETL